jgi:hypothetical protein
MRTWDELLSPARRLFDTHPEEVDRRAAGEPIPLVASCGLGLNSAAGLVLFSKIGVRPDAVLFADTGGEKHETYAYREALDRFLGSVGFPPVTTVKRDVDHARQKHEEKYSTLEEECLVKKSLPSIAFYGRSCSQKWKHAPQDKWANHWQPALDCWAGGGKVLKAIFYEAGEEYRATIASNSGYQFWYPLLDYDWGREECEEALRLAGLPVPPKSSCFFCPEMTPEEIIALPDDLKARALAIEDNAVLTSVKGLGKHEYSWREVVEGKIPLPVKREKRVPCMCHEG